MHILHRMCKSAEVGPYPAHKRAFHLVGRPWSFAARVDGAAGPLALGAKGSACDRLRLTGGLRAFALGSYIVSLRWRGTAPLRAPFFMPPLAAKTRQRGFRPSENHTTALRASEMHPFWWLAPPPSPRRGDFILRYALALFCPACGGSPAQPG